VYKFTYPIQEELQKALEKQKEASQLLEAQTEAVKRLRKELHMPLDITYLDREDNTIVVTVNREIQSDYGIKGQLITSRYDDLGNLIVQFR